MMKLLKNRYSVFTLCILTCTLLAVKDGLFSNLYATDKDEKNKYNVVFLSDSGEKITEERKGIYAFSDMGADETFTLKKGDADGQGNTDRNATQKKEKPGEVKGEIVISVERFTIGTGFVKEPVTVEFTDKDTVSSIIRKRIGTENFIENPSYGDNYLAAINGANPGVDKIKVPSYISKLAANGEAKITTESAKKYGNKKYENEKYKGKALGEFSYSKSSGWNYCVNGIFPGVGIADYKPSDGDVIRLQFTLNLGKDLKGDDKIKINNKDNLLSTIARVNGEKTFLKDRAVEKFYKDANEVAMNMISSKKEIEKATGALSKEISIVRKYGPNSSHSSYKPKLKLVNKKTLNGIQYSVLSHKKRTLEVVSAKKSIKYLKIADWIKLNGKSYKVTSLRGKAFVKNKKLKSAVIGANVNYIGKATFSGCKKLKSIKFKGKALKKVGKSALKRVYKRVEIRTPKKVLKKYRKIMKRAGAPRKARYREI